MTADATIRETAPEDRAAVLALHRRAFPEEDLTALVAALLDTGEPVLSLGAFDGESETLVAHALFSLCGVGAEAKGGALLGPLGVTPDRQRRGYGSALVREGMARLADRGVARILVLGDPAYYGRLGFQPETRVTPPYPLPPEWAAAWASVILSPEPPPVAGRLIAPPPWMDIALWGPNVEGT